MARIAKCNLGFRSPLLRFEVVLLRGDFLLPKTRFAVIGGSGSGEPLAGAEQGAALLSQLRTLDHQQQIAFLHGGTEIPRDLDCHTGDLWHDVHAAVVSNFHLARQCEDAA